MTRECRKVIVVVAVVIAVIGRYADAAAPKAVDQAEHAFLKDVKPLLASRCLTCHGPDKSEGGLRLDTRKLALKGGDSGPALAPGRPDQSLLLMAVKRTHKLLEMPPKEKLSSKDITALEHWIESGAPWPDDAAEKKPQPRAVGERIGDAWSDSRNPIAQLFGGQRLDLWSLKPVKRPDVRAVKQRDWPKGDTDRFVLAHLEREKLTPQEPADARTLARRLYYDLSGLPPTPDQVSQFKSSVDKNGVDAATKSLVEELLASSHFGEHFARLWLDVVRYSDSNGFDWDEFRKQAWRYRDYVVRKFNADIPFDQFIREQLAGDELLSGAPKTADDQDCLIATSFLRLGPHDNAAGLFNEQDRSRAELLADVTETTAGAFLGLTLTCCRCHDHKYDPISQADHYRFRAFFAAMKFADGTSLDLAPDQAAIFSHNEALEQAAKPLREKLAAIPEANKSERRVFEKLIAAIEAMRRPYKLGLLMTDTDEKVPATYVLFQGDHKSPRAAVEPGILSVFDPQPASLIVPVNPKTTGRRLTLANWIASPQNPLTARVYVNRIWTSLMGTPLVATPNDFGFAGSPPEDAALLDWLASQFTSHNWSTKELVRQIVTSAAYRQMPTFAAEHFALRVPRRASAEQLRDSLLFVSGLLTAKADGAPIWPDLPPEVLDSNPAFLDDNPEKTKGWYPSPKADQYCRSLFLVQKRNTRTPLLESFDLPDNSTSCPRRPVSTIAPQALMLLNSSLTAEASHAFAKRVEREAGKQPGAQVKRAFELALQREPDKLEVDACEQLLTKRSLPELCRAILNLNEFVYID